MSEQTYTKVGDVMSQQLRTIARTATAQEAIDLLKQSGVSSLVVPRHDEADECALVTITDLAREVVAVDRAPDRTYVYDIMTKPVLTLPVNMNVKYACRLLAKFKLSRALVVDGNREPVGIVTLRDMVLHGANVDTGAETDAKAKTAAEAGA